MKVVNLIKDNNFHDSCLENLFYVEKMRTLSLVIDFCCWAQKDFKEGDAENKIVNLKFDDVADLNSEDYEIDSDSILDFKLKDDGRIELVVESDSEGVQVISFRASSVTFD
jgi:hypothetical protein